MNTPAKDIDEVCDRLRIPRYMNSRSLQKLKKRFLKKVTITESDCWEFTLKGNNHGYGQMGVGSTVKAAHQIAWAIWAGKIPKWPKVLDHLCNNPRCVFADHLKVTTNKKNILRGTSFAAKNARKTHCPLGHRYDEVKTKNGLKSRGCSKCRKHFLRKVYWVKRWTKKFYKASSIARYLSKA